MYSATVGGNRHSFADLKTLLAGSGLDISEKSVVAPVANRPGNGRR